MGERREMERSGSGLCLHLSILLRLSLPRDGQADIRCVRAVDARFDGGGEMLSQGGMMLSNLAQGDLDGAGNVHPCAFRRRTHFPRPPAKTNSTGQFVGEKSISAARCSLRPRS